MSDYEALNAYIRAALAVWDMRVVEMDSDAECCRKIVAILKDSVQDHPEYETPEKRCNALEDACRKMLEVTGGSKHWNGGTHEALKMMETALVLDRR